MADHVAQAEDLSEFFNETDGDESIAYVRKVSFEDLREMLPEMDVQGASFPMWAILSAEGTPIALAESRGAAFGSAIAHDLKPVSVH